MTRKKPSRNINMPDRKLDGPVTKARGDVKKGPKPDRALRGPVDIAPTIPDFKIFIKTSSKKKKK